MSDCSWVLPKVRAELAKLAPNQEHPEDAFWLLMREGALGVLWAAADRKPGIAVEDAEFTYGGMVKQ